MVIAIMMGSCGGGKYAATEKIYKGKAKNFAELYKRVPEKDQLENIRFDDKQWIASTNFGVRKPNYVMIHHTAQHSLEQTVQTFHNQKVGVSSHYVIARDGKIVQMVNDLYRAHHAGLGRWGNDTDLNSSSIGIELDNNGTTDPWPEVQIKALMDLLDYLKETYNIPAANFIGHMDYAPSRKLTRPVSLGRHWQNTDLVIGMKSLWKRFRKILTRNWLCGLSVTTSRMSRQLFGGLNNIISRKIWKAESSPTGSCAFCTPSLKNTSKSGEDKPCRALANTAG